MTFERRRADREFAEQLGFYSKFGNKMPYTSVREEIFCVRKGLPWPERLLTTDGTYPYVVMPLGEVRIAVLPRPKGAIHHSQMAKGREVIAAGMIKIIGGKVVRISNESGHYEPDEVSVNAALFVFRYWNIPLAEDVELFTTAPLS